MEDFQPVGAGQHDVEHDHIGKAPRAGRTELHIVRHAFGLDPRLREGVKRQLANARVVFHAVHHSLPPSLAENPYLIDYRTEGRVQARGGSPARREGWGSGGGPRSSPARPPGARAGPRWREAESYSVGISPTFKSCVPVRRKIVHFAMRSASSPMRSKYFAAISSSGRCVASASPLRMRSTTTCSARS